VENGSPADADFGWELSASNFVLVKTKEKSMTDSAISKIMGLSIAIVFGIGLVLNAFAFN
jgi:hypothetical protein